MNAKTPSLAAFVAAFLSSFAADAATVTLDYTLPPPSGPMPTAVSAGGYVQQNVVGDETAPGAPVRLSPWSGTAFEDIGLYSAAMQGSSASYSFLGIQQQLDLMWGSPEASNTIEFLLNRVVQFTLTGASVLTPADPAPSFVNVTVADLKFDSLQFRSPEGTFEFAALKVTEIPLPGAMWMALAALAGLGFGARRRKAG